MQDFVFSTHRQQSTTNPNHGCCHCPWTMNAMAAACTIEPTIHCRWMIWVSGKVMVAWFQWCHQFSYNKHVLYQTQQCCQCPCHQWQTRCHQWPQWLPPPPLSSLIDWLYIELVRRDIIGFFILASTSTLYVSVGRLMTLASTNWPHSMVILVARNDVPATCHQWYVSREPELQMKPWVNAIRQQIALHSNGDGHGQSGSSVLRPF